MRPLALSALLLSVLVACDQPTVSTPASLADRIGTIHYAYAPPSTSDSAHRVRARTSHEDRLAVERIFDTSGDWREADERIRPFLAEEGLDPVRAARRVQTAGVAMLRVLPDGAPDAERTEAFAYYVCALNRAGSPEAMDLDRAIGLLETHWSDAEIEAARADVVDNAETYVARSIETGRASSESFAAALAASGEPPMDVFEARIQRVAERMRADA